MLIDGGRAVVRAAARRRRTGQAFIPSAPVGAARCATSATSTWPSGYTALRPYVAVEVDAGKE